MSQFFSRRQFLRGAGATVVGIAFLAHRGEGRAVAVQANSEPLSLTEIERWLLGTGQDDLDPEIFAILAGTSSSRVFLPIVAN